MWDLPVPGLEPVFPALAGRFVSTAPPGKPCTLTLDWCHMLYWMLLSKDCAKHNSSNIDLAERRIWLLDVSRCIAWHDSSGCNDVFLCMERRESWCFSTVYDGLLFSLTVMDRCFKEITVIKYSSLQTFSIFSVLRNVWWDRRFGPCLLFVSLNCLHRCGFCLLCHSVRMLFLCC